jgi:hypothetical protein
VRPARGVSPGQARCEGNLLAGRSPHGDRLNRGSIGSRSCSRIAFGCRRRRRAPRKPRKSRACASGPRISREGKGDRHRCRHPGPRKRSVFDETGRGGGSGGSPRGDRDRGCQKQARTPASGRTRRRRAKEGAPLGRTRDHGSYRSDRGWATGDRGQVRCSVEAGGSPSSEALPGAFVRRDSGDTQGARFECRLQIWEDASSPLRAVSALRAGLPERGERAVGG